MWTSENNEENQALFFSTNYRVLFSNLLPCPTRL